MTADHNDAPIKPLDHDPLDDFEPVSVPRKRLYWAAGLCFFLPLSLVTPMGPADVKWDEWWGNTIVRQFAVGYVRSVGEIIEHWMILSPALMVVIVGCLALRMARVPFITVMPQSVCAISFILSIFPLSWMLVFVCWTIRNPPPPRTRDWILLACMSGFGMAAVAVFFLARLGPGRGAAAITATGLFALMPLSVPVIGAFAKPDRIFPLLHIFPAAALAVVILGVSCLLVYRRQRQREKEFEKLMRERESRRRNLDAFAP